MNVECNTGGGMGPDKLATSVVVFATGEHEEGEPGYPLRIIGVITPQQPYAEGSPPDMEELNSRETSHPHQRDPATSRSAA